MPVKKPPEGEPSWLTFRRFFDGVFSLGGAASDFLYAFEERGCIRYDSCATFVSLSWLAGTQV